MKTTPEIHEKLIAKLRSDIDLANARLSAGYYYASLPLAVTDAVFSIGVRYETVVNSVHHLARRAGWEVYRPLGSPYLDPGRQHTISELLAEFKKAFDPTEVFGNRGYANPAAARPIPKAILVQQVAGVLAANGIENFNDFAAYPKLEALEETLRSLPAMSSGVAVSYLGMLCGNDENIKPDRHIHAFIRMASGNSGLVISNAEAVSLMQEAAHSQQSRTGCATSPPDYWTTPSGAFSVTSEVPGKLEPSFCQKAALRVRQLTLTAAHQLRSQPVAQVFKGRFK